MHQFSTRQDVSIIQRMDAERFSLYYQPRVWLSNNDQLTTNIYGEPGDAIDGIDGVTSVKATKQFTSTTSDFVTAKVSKGDVIELFDPDGKDNCERKIESVDSPTQLTVSQDWPVGQQTGINFVVTYMNEKYTATDFLVPFHIKLDPTEDDLKKWGIEQTKDIDALIEMSIYLCTQIGLTPKIGDRISYPYGDKLRQYEVLTLIERDQLTDSQIPLHYVGSLKKTRDILPTQ